MLYSLILAIHNILRWVVLALGVIALGRAYLGWFTQREWTETDCKVGLFLTMGIDTQLLLGLLLYVVLSPITKTAFQDFRAAMKVDDLRFFALEHAFYMLLALIFAHLGSILPRRVSDAVAKHSGLPSDLPWLCC